MTLAVARMHNFPPYLTYISILPDVVKRKQVTCISLSLSSLSGSENNWFEGV